MKTQHLLLATLLVAASCTTPAPRPEDKPEDKAPPVEPAKVEAAPVAVRILAFNDFHGNLEGPTGTVEVAGKKLEAGGVAAFAQHLKRLREGHDHTLTACAGDLIGASPLVSAMFHDEPTVEAMDLLKLDLCAVGNHEFDEGQDELLRIQNGGCHPVDGCKGKESYPGAQFQFLGANVKVEATQQPLLPPYSIKEFAGVKVGFIGLTLEDTPGVVSPDGIRGLKFEDEIEVINRYAAELKAQGVASIIVLIHEGGYADGVKDVNDCGDLQGPIVPIAKGADPAVVAFVTGHSHQLYNCTIEGRVVTSAKSFGRAITVLDLTLDPKTGLTTAIKATNHPVTTDVPADEPTSSLVARYRELVGPLAAEIVGALKAPIARETDPSGLSPLGMLIADAQLAATKKAPANAQIALMNMGGVRDDLKGGANLDVTFEMLHRIQPFGNALVTLSLTGAQLEALLEEQFVDDRSRPLQPSAGLSYTWKASGPAGDKIDPKQVKIAGKTLDLKATYRVTVNSYLATGGDGFKTLVQGTAATGGMIDLDALVAYARANKPLIAPKPDRIKKTN
jgi:5'-nucleotidase